MCRDDVGGVDASPPLEFHGIDVSLPLEFGAFCMLHGAHYRTYALCRLGDGTAARHTVRCALGELLVAWPAALMLSPAAVGWRLLRRETAIALRGRVRPPADAVHRLVAGPAADAGLLHHGLGLPAKDIAELMGCDAECATYWLLTFQRHLAQQSGGELRAAVETLRTGRTPVGAGGVSTGTGTGK
ncbi:hypothetical protein GCM10018793_58740 [Streptomyces sulfonofaciens]|uniref:Uncharacterized protein n=1 Tax=Streptomyces sulfonofaciens TaxID=68272 RepID=A0A919GMP4_9ACTN|nr:hypothetical protein [Streptomyces sulfonofaciens]GHH86535.1 hypothetical protein GCM10018793_58740 [Streptomyces sulfonofaciens]